MNYTKRKDGRYQTNISIGNGRKKTLTANTIKELKQKEKELRIKLSQGVDIVSQNDTLKLWADRVKADKKIKLSPHEYSRFESRLEIFLKEIGCMKLTEINVMHIQPIIDTLALENPTTHKPTAKKTLRAYNLTLSQVFEYAIKNRVTQFNPCKYIDIPEDAPKQIRKNLTLEQQEWIVKTEHPMKLPAMIMLFAGLRRGEVSALQWSDIDFNNNTITVNKSLDIDTGGIKSPKTQAGYRTIAMPDILSDYLKSVPRTALFLCTSKNGKKMTDRAWRTYWSDYLSTIQKLYGRPIFDQNGEILIRLPIEEFTPHQLRHTYCTALKDSGVNIKDAQSLMGHADSQTTINIYTHTDGDSHKEAVEKLNVLLLKKFG